MAVNSGRVADKAGLPADHSQRFGAGRPSAAVRIALEA